MKTFSAKPHEVKRQWHLIDADGKSLGRMASEIASRLRGKHKPEFTPHVDTGDYIVVINSDKVAVTGNKSSAKMYHWHTGYIGNLKSRNFAEMMELDSTRVITKAVKGMLPKGPLGRAMLKKLKIYKDGAHPHAAQSPKELEI